MVAGKAKGKTKSINRGRPPLLKSQSALSSKATRNIIRSHHTLHKAHAKAVENEDAARADEIGNRIAANGGLQSYQLASTLGQSSDRGGDSSKVLVDWLKPVFQVASAQIERLRLLEIGALGTKNACSQIGGLEVMRIDLRSQQPGIQEIDFMLLPEPKLRTDRFDIISLSLVLNFVPEPYARGEMLKRIPKFLRTPDSTSHDGLLPCLFLVLPLPCVSNSRYLTEGRLEEMMRSLSFTLTKSKKTSKLIYMLWRFCPAQAVSSSVAFKKEEVRSGGLRNNFAIILR